MLFSLQTALQKKQNKVVKFVPLVNLGPLVLMCVNVFPRIIRLFRNPFQNTLRYKELSDSAEPNKVSLFHAIETTNNRLFRCFNRLFF